MNISDSRTFCPAPWSHIRLGTKGSIGICPYSPDLQNSIDIAIDIASNQTVIEIKDTIKNEQWHHNCSYCQEAETIGGRSERLMYVKLLEPSVKKQIDEQPEKNYIESASINLDNLCNLSCNYCNPATSTQWMKVLGIPVTLARTQNSNLDFLLSNRQNLKYLTLGGGEPLLQKGIHQLLSNLLHDRKIFVFITTNLSIDLEKNLVFDSIINNPSIETTWMISFDGLGEKFEYVRHGADWEQFKRNIYTLNKYNQKIVAHPAYSLYSAFDLVKYYDFCDSMDLDVFWCDLFDPIELDIRHAPESIRQLAIENIDAALEKFKDRKNLSLDTLAEYRKMAQIGMPTNTTTVDVSTLTDYQRSVNIVAFNFRIEQLMSKSKSFEQLWPDVFNKLKEYTK